MYTEIDESTPLLRQQGKNGTSGPASKKDKKAKKLAKLKAKLGRDEDEVLEKLEKQPRSSAKSWSEALSVREALPIKQGGKVIRTLRVDEKSYEEANEDIGDGEYEEERKDTGRSRKRNRNEEMRESQRALKKSNADKKKGAAASREEEGDEEENEFEYTPDFSELAERGGLSGKKRNGSKKLASRDRDQEEAEDDEDEEEEEEEEQDVEDEDAKYAAAVAAATVEKKQGNMSKAAEKTRKSMEALGRLPLPHIQAKIADICTSITADPERSLKRKPTSTSTPGVAGVKTMKFSDSEGGASAAVDGEYRMSDLFDILTAPLAGNVIEMAMLSMLLVFKDICPTYRIRPPSEQDLTVQLKKETKKLRDFEFGLLGAYQRYLKFLEKTVTLGLGNPRKLLPETKWEEKGGASLLGLSALRCQCELLRYLPHFNFRTSIITSVVARCMQPNDEISSICCDALANVFKSDKEGEASLDAVKLLARMYSIVKYDMPVQAIRVLENVKLQVHADESRRLKLKNKQQRRKRRKTTDEVELGLLESNATVEKSIAQKFQADSLHEICLVYFRIVKNKVGFDLLPAALEGLSRITHLMNIDMVEDLVILLKGLIEATPPPPPTIRLHCVLCALKTLSGPGEELGFDKDCFIECTRLLIKEIPLNFDHWDKVFEAVELSLLKRREDRAGLVLTFVKLLLLSASHLPSSGGGGGVTALSLAHAILLRYPRARSSLLAEVMFKSGSSAGGEGGGGGGVMVDDEEEQVVDLAMQALRGGEDGAGGGWGGDAEGGEGEGGGESGKWMLPLLGRHIDPLYKRVVSALSSKDITTVPLRFGDASSSVEQILQRVDTAFNVLPSALGRGRDGGSAKAAKHFGEDGGEGFAKGGGRRGGGMGKREREQKRLELAGKSKPSLPAPPLQVSAPHDSFKVSLNKETKKGLYKLYGKTSAGY